MVVVCVIVVVVLVIRFITIENSKPAELAALLFWFFF